MAEHRKTGPARHKPKVSAAARQGRIAALVIAGTGVLWLVAQYLGGAGKIPGRYMMLVDLAALAAFLWALIVTWRIWRIRDGK